MKNILLEHVDIIFGLSRQHNVDLGIALDMFRANIRGGAEVYRGLPERRAPDYIALGIEWNALTLEEQSAQVNTYNDFVRENYKALVELSQADQCAEMIALATAED